MTNRRGRDRQWQWWWWKRGQQPDPPGKYTTPSFTHHITLTMPPPPSQSSKMTSDKHPPHAHEQFLRGWITGAHCQCHPHPTPRRCGRHSTRPHAYEQLLVGWDRRCSLSTMTGQGGDNTASTSTSRMMMGCRAGGTTWQRRGMTPTPHLRAPACRVDCGHLQRWDNKGNDTTTRGHDNDTTTEMTICVGYCCFSVSFFLFLFSYSIVLINNSTSFSREKLDQLCWKRAPRPQPTIRNMYRRLGHVSFFYFLSFLFNHTNH
jgi:hypothetical protein